MGGAFVDFIPDGNPTDGLGKGLTDFVPTPAEAKPAISYTDLKLKAKSLGIKTSGVKKVELEILVAEAEAKVVEEPAVAEETAK